MTGQERLSAILNRQPVDKLAWTTLVDDATLNNLPAKMKGMSPIDFYQYIGCDIFLLNTGGCNRLFLLRSWSGRKG